MDSINQAANTVIPIVAGYCSPFGFGDKILAGALAVSAYITANVPRQ